MVRGLMRETLRTGELANCELANGELANGEPPVQD